MREVVISIRCDDCEENFQETHEGANAVTFNVDGKQWEMDLCYRCLGGPMFEHARPVKPKNEKPFPCPMCPKKFDTQRGLSTHDTRAHNP